MEQESHYAVYMLDKYTNKVHIIDPHEVSLKEIQEESDRNMSGLVFQDINFPANGPCAHQPQDYF